ncbi:hypothetical protein [Priestia taiwanensis]|uniref:Uncharacterized protein n=1 Tax=Priestia taiwanensis TaxID=1347902 RepID=A0A917AJS2_9BACI|nr:hypothetical protein [Priestia taiwanensis]MBM7361915.1 hypothetical protein [Priestia taiwanensis]GGE57959.1 hypothetical protein GCM10007140_05420 [Priestia taiwanensis]
MRGLDPYWRGCLHLFKYCLLLRKYFNTDYMHVGNGVLEVEKLRHVFRTKSHSEKIMLNLALHLFNGDDAFRLTDLDYLDKKNKRLAFEAMLLRFSYIEVGEGDE